MSRGSGRVERILLEQLHEHRDELRPELWLGLDKLMGLGPSERSWRVSVRRAAISLERKGLVERVYFHGHATERATAYFDAAVGPGNRRFVSIRIRLEADHMTDVAELANEYEQHLERLVASDEAGDLAARQRELSWIDWYEAPTLLPFVAPRTDLGPWT